MAEPAEEDVRRLVALIDEGQYHDSAVDPGSMARRLLAAGVTLPSEPDTPPEPQERWRAGSGETGDAHIVYGADGMRADCYRSERSIGIEDRDFARSLVALLRLDAKYEDQGGVGKAIEQADVRSRMRSAAMSRMEAELDEANKNLRTTSRHYAKMKAERDEARAEVERLTELVQKLQTKGEYEVGHEHGQASAANEVKRLRAEVERLTAELAKREAWENELAVELPEDWDDDSAQSHIIAEYVREMGRRLSAAGISRHRFVDEAPAVPQDDGPAEPQIPWVPLHEAKEADTATEPLFTGRVDAVTGDPGNGRTLVTIETTDLVVEEGIKEKVDIFPAGVRPAAPPHEFQGHPGGVCTSCDCQMETGNHLRPTEPLFTALMVDHDGTKVTLAAEDSTSTYPRRGARLVVYDGWSHRPIGAGPTNQPVTAEMVYEAIEAAGVRDGLDRGDGPAYIRPCDWTTGETSVVADALNVQLGRTPPPQEDDDAR